MNRHDIVDVAERAFCRCDSQNKRHRRDEPGENNSAPKRPDIFIAFDTESATNRTKLMPGFEHARWSWQTQNLLFGVARIGVTANWSVTDEIIFYPDDLPEHGKTVLRRYIEENTIALSPRGRDANSSYVVQLPEREKTALPELRWRDDPEISVWLLPYQGF